MLVCSVSFFDTSRIFHSPPNFVRNDVLTKQLKLTAIIQSRQLCLFGHIMCIDDNADSKRIMTLLASPPADWKRQPGRLCITWLSTVQQDLKQHHLTLPEAADLAQNRPVWRIMSTYGATQSHSCMPETTTTLPELTRIVYPACILHELFSHCYQLFSTVYATGNFDIKHLVFSLITYIIIYFKHVWTPRLNPHCNHKFHGEGEGVFFTGQETHPW